MLTHLIKTGKKLDENIFRIIYAGFVVQVKPQLAEWEGGQAFLIVVIAPGGFQRAEDGGWVIGFVVLGI